MNLYRLNEAPRAKGAPGRTLQPAAFQPGMPPIACPVCGKTWSVHTVRIEEGLPRDHPLGNQPRRPVPPEVFRQMAAEARRALNMAPDAELLPGTDFGLPRLVCRRPVIEPLEFPDFRTVVITEAVREYFEKSGLTGFRAAQLRLVTRPRKVQIPKLHVLVAEGRAELRTEVRPEVLSRCGECGRAEMSAPVSASVELDESTWDGGDFVRLTWPLAGGMYVTDRVKAALEAGPFGNWSLSPLADEILEARSRAESRKKSD